MPLQQPVTGNTRAVLSQLCQRRHTWPMDHIGWVFHLLCGLLRDGVTACLPLSPTGVHCEGGGAALTSQLGVHTRRCPAGAGGQAAHAVTLCGGGGEGCGSASCMEHVETAAGRCSTAMRQLLAGASVCVSSVRAPATLHLHTHDSSFKPPLFDYRFGLRFRATVHVV